MYPLLHPASRPDVTGSTSTGSTRSESCALIKAICPLNILVFIMAPANAQSPADAPQSIRTASIEEFRSKNYDYVICGGGTAGLVVAARLTENPEVRVAVLEAGKYRRDDPLIDTPAAFPQLAGNPEYDWGLKSQPQVRSLLKTLTCADDRFTGRLWQCTISCSSWEATWRVEWNQLYALCPRL